MTLSENDKVIHSTQKLKIELELGNKEDFEAKGKAKMSEAGKKHSGNQYIGLEGLSPSDKPSKPHNTRTEIAKAAQRQTIGGYKHNPSVLSLNDKTEHHNTRKEIAKAGKLGREKQLGVLSPSDKTPVEKHNTREQNVSLSPSDKVTPHNTRKDIAKAAQGQRTDLLSLDDKKLPVLSTNDKSGPPHSTRKLKIELELGNKEDLLEKGEQVKVEAGKQARAVQLGVLSPSDKTPAEKHNTQKEIAKAAGVSTGQVGMAEQVKNHDSPFFVDTKKNHFTPLTFVLESL